MKRKQKSQAPPVLPVVLIIAGALLLAGALAWSSAGAPPATSTPPAGQDSIPYPQVKRVDLEQARTALEQSQAVFVDVRDAQSYASQHIRGARNIPGSELEKRYAELDPQRWIITYCT